MPKLWPRQVAVQRSYGQFTDQARSPVASSLSHPAASASNKQSPALKQDEPTSKRAHIKESPRQRVSMD